MEQEGLKKTKTPKYLTVKCLQKKLNSIIESNKQSHNSRLLISWSVKKDNWSNEQFKSLLVDFENVCFWTIKNSLHYNFNSPKQNKYVTNFKEKVEIFWKKKKKSFLKESFAEQCSFMNNSSKLSLSFLKRKEKVISSISYSSNDITKIFRDLYPNKAS